MSNPGFFASITINLLHVLSFIEIEISRLKSLLFECYSADIIILLEGVILIPPNTGSKNFSKKSFEYFKQYARPLVNAGSSRPIILKIESEVNDIFSFEYILK